MSITTNVPSTMLVRDLREGDQFLSPGGKVLTVRRTRLADLTHDGIEVLTVEEYLPDENFIASADYRVRFVMRPGITPEWAEAEEERLRAEEEALVEDMALEEAVRLTQDMLGASVIARW